MPEVEDPRIEQFFRSGRRRNAIAAAVVGALLILGGAITLIVLLTQDVDLDNKTGIKQGAGYQVIVYAGGAIVIGIGVIIVGLRGLRGARPVDVATKKAEPHE